MNLMRHILFKRVHTVGFHISQRRIITAYHLKEQTTPVFNNIQYAKNFSSSLDKNDRQQTNNTSTSAAKLTSGQKLKKAVADYGITVIVFHIGMSLISLGSCYLIVSSGLDVEQLLLRLKLDEWVKGNTVLVSNAGTFAVAYAIHKVFAPIRVGITITSVPLIVKYLRSKKILK